MKTDQEKVEVMQHFINGGVVTESPLNCHAPLISFTITKSPSWNWSDFDFNIYQEPKKKIKLEAWISRSSMQLYFTAAPYSDGQYAYRAPQLDTEVEE